MENPEALLKENDMQTNTHLFFDGNCKAAFEHYERHLRGKIEINCE